MNDAFGSYRAIKYFGSLNGLRCACILAVIWHRTAGAGRDALLLSRGYLGVSLFFVISGFLITTLMLREREAYGQISVGAFLARRALRIFPLYYLVLSGNIEFPAATSTSFER